MSDRSQSEEAADAASDAVDPERLLPNEDPDSPYLEDAEHWRSVYDELLDAKASILDRRARGSRPRPSCPCATSCPSTRR